MPFWKRKKDPEVEAARAAAEATLPAGWSLKDSDREIFSVPRGQVYTYAIPAVGPAGETALVIAVGEANAYGHFARFMRGDLEVAEGWAVPVPPLDEKRMEAYLSVRNADDPDVLAAKQELDAALPSGWELFMSDRERYAFPNGYLETWAVAAGGPGDEAELVMGLGEAGGFRQLARRLRGELEIADAWAPPMEGLTRR